MWTDWLDGLACGLSQTNPKGKFWSFLLALVIIVISIILIYYKN